MTSTHAVVGALLGAGVGVLVPELSGAAILVGFVGGAFPDADLLVTHRRTGHFPVLAPVVAVPVTAVAAISGSAVAVLCAVFVLAAAVHCVMDVFGGGVEHRPWEATSDRGVYDHVRGRWIRPRRWVRWAGAPEDLALAVAVGLPVMAASSGSTRTLLGAVLAVSAGFVAVRRRLPALTERLLDGSV